MTRYASRRWHCGRIERYGTNGIHNLEEGASWLLNESLTCARRFLPPEFSPARRLTALVKEITFPDYFVFLPFSVTSFFVRPRQP